MSPASVGSPSSPDIQTSSVVGFTDTAAQIGEVNAAEAEAINSNFNLVAYGIAHGPGGPDAYGHLPEVEIEYEGAEAVINSLDPARGDVLFVEDVGHDPTAETTGKPTFQWSDHLDYLEAERATRSISPGLYLNLLARARGIPVVPADLTRQQVEAYNSTIGQDAMVEGVNPE